MRIRVSIDLDVGLNKVNTLYFVEECFASGVLNVDKKRLLKEFPNLKLGKFQATYSAEKIKVLEKPNA